MFKKAVFLAVLILALSLGSAFANQIDGLSSGGINPSPLFVAGPVSPTSLYVNPGGLGDVLLYGYYNVRGGQNEFFTVTNTSDVTGARVRIRFREAATLGAPECNGSHEILDFDICLSKGDMWTGHIFSGPDGAGWLKSNDGHISGTKNLETWVQVSGKPDGTGTIVQFSDAFPNGQPFKYGAKSDNSSITADMTREGYFEIIAERAMRDCTAQEILDKTCTCGDQMDLPLTDVGNVLMGHAYMVNLGTMETYGYVATAIANFTSHDITPADGIGSAKPDLQDSDDAVLLTPPNAIDPVNYALTKRNLYGIYDLEANFGGNTAWIVTFPTKWITHTEYVDSKGACKVAATGGSLDTPDIFDDPSVAITIWDDAENKDTPSECEFSPCPTTPGNSLPNEVNVLNIQNSSIFVAGATSAESVTKAINFQTQSFDFGWINIDLVDTAGVGTPVITGTLHEITLGTLVTKGLPAIGYQAMKFAGGKATGMLPLQYKTDISPAL